MERKRPLGVTIIGWYFIIQGWIALGYHGEFGNFAIVFVALFIGIGIGLLKLYNIARVSAISLVGIISFICLFRYVSLVNQDSTPMHTGKLLACFIFFTILLILFWFYFTRSNVKDHFD